MPFDSNATALLADAFRDKRTVSMPIDVQYYFITNTGKNPQTNTAKWYADCDRLVAFINDVAAYDVMTINVAYGLSREELQKCHDRSGRPLHLNKFLFNCEELTFHPRDAIPRCDMVLTTSDLYNPLAHTQHIYYKNYNGTFARGNDPALLPFLNRNKKNALLVMGMYANVCVLETIIGGLENDFEIFVVDDQTYNFYGQALQKNSSADAAFKQKLARECMSAALDPDKVHRVSSAQVYAALAQAKPTASPLHLRA